MAGRYFNWKLAIVIVMALVVLGVTVVGLRRLQRTRRAEKGLTLGTNAYERQDWQQAADQLGRYISLNQDDVPVLLKYADAQLGIRPARRGNIRQAIAAYRNVLRVDPLNSEAALRLCEIYLSMAIPGEAELIATRQLEKKQDFELRRLLAVSLAAQRKFDQAVNQLKTIIVRQPHMVLAYEVLGKLAEHRPELFDDSPESLYNQAVKDNPSSALAYIVRSAFYLRTGQKPMAIADLEQADKLDLSDLPVQLRLVRELMNVGLLDKADSHLRAVYAVEPKNQLLWQFRALLALRSGSQSKMVEAADAGLNELAAQPWDFMPLAAELYIRADQLERAQNCLSLLRQNDVTPATTAFLEGLLADIKGNGYEAVKCWKRALELGYEPAKVRNILALELSRLGDTQSAVKHLRVLVSERPNSYTARINLARVLGEAGNWAEAVQQAHAALQLRPDSTEAAEFLAEAEMVLITTAPLDQALPLYQNVEDQLAQLEQMTGTTLTLRLLQFQLAMHKNDTAQAEKILADLKNLDPNAPKVILAEAQLLVAQHNTAQAIDMLNRYINDSASPLIPVKYLTSLLRAEGRYQECQDTLEQLLPNTQDPQSRQEIALLLTGIYTLQNEHDKCYKMLNTLSRQLPENIVISRELLNCKQIYTDPNRAQQLVDNIRTIEGQTGWQWRYEQAKLWFKQDDFETSYPRIISLLEENLLANPADQAGRMLLAAAHERAGKMQLAVSTYAEALARSPQDVRVIVPTISAMYRAGEYSRADAILQRLSRKGLEHPDLKRLQLQAYIRRGEYASATDVLEQFWANEPNDQSVGMSLVLLNMRQNRFAQAQDLLDKLRTRQPDSMPLTVVQIELYARQAKHNEAVALSNELVNSRQDAAGYLIRARTYAILGNPDAAREDLDRAVLTEPNSIEAWLSKADFCRSTALLDEAIAAVNRALTLAPDDIQVLHRAISVYLSSDDPAIQQQGWALLDRALQANPADLTLRLQKARLLIAEGTAPAISEATDILKKLTEENPTLPDAWCLLADLALRRQQPIRAIDLITRGLVHSPNDKNLLLLKARAEAVRSPLLALPTLKALREQNPADLDIVLYLADTYLAIGDFDQALDSIKAQSLVSHSSQDRRKIDTALAVALYKTGDEQQAKELFAHLSESAHGDPSPLLAQVRVLSDARQWDQLDQILAQYRRHYIQRPEILTAIADQLVAGDDKEPTQMAANLLRQTLARHPKYIPALDRLARIMLITAQNAEAADLYTRLLQLRPDHIVAINNLAWILCEHQGQYDHALQLANRGLQQEPQYIHLAYVDLIDTRGVVYFRLGQYRKAVEDFNRCIRLYPPDAASLVASYFHLARALEKLGQNSEAVRTLNKTIEMNDQFGGLATTDLAEAQELLNNLTKGGT